MIKKTLSMLLCGMLVLSIALTGCGKKEEEKTNKEENETASTQTTANYNVVYFNGDEDGIIAEVNGEKVTEDEFEYFLMVSMMNELNSGSEPVENSKDYWTDEKLEDIMESAMNQCVLLHVYRTVAIDEGIKLTDEDKTTIDSQIKSAEEYYGPEVFDMYLEAEGMTRDMYKEFNTMSFYASKLYEDYSKDVVKDDEIKQYFMKNYVKAKHILISKTNEEGADVSADAYTKIENIKAQLDGGADFDTLMKENSEDPGLATAPDGYVFTKGEMVAEFEEAAFNLEPGQMSDIVETTYGYHILKKVELTDAALSEEITDNYGNKTTYKETVKNILASDKYSAFLEERKGDAKVKVNKTVYGKYESDAVDMYDAYYANGEKVYQQINEMQAAQQQAEPSDDTAEAE